MKNSNNELFSTLIIPKQRKVRTKAEVIEIKEKANQLFKLGKTPREVSRQLHINEAQSGKWRREFGFPLLNQRNVPKPERKNSRLGSEEAAALKLIALPMFKAGMTPKQVADELKILSSLASRWRREAGFDALRINLTDAKKAEAIQMARDGYKFRQIADKLNVTNSTIQRVFRSNNVEKRRNTSPNHSEEIKIKAIKLIEAGNNYRYAELNTGVTASTIKRWYQTAVEQGLAKKVKKSNRGEDLELYWLTRKRPDFEAWRILASEWVLSQKNVSIALLGLSAFFDRYLIGYGLPVDPIELLKKSNRVLPDFYKNCLPQSMSSFAVNNVIHSFLEWVLLKDCSIEDEFGEPMVQRQLFHNPIPALSATGKRTHSESVKATLPYGYISRLRKILSPGPDFRDWKWAQTSMGERRMDDDGELVQGSSTDWFEVTWEQIDKEDPDCVWRERRGIDPKTPLVLEMWSPVRWVALLHKLQTPPRGFQVRMLDSGEGDTWRYVKGHWELNSGPHKRGTRQKPVENGIFRRIEDQTNGTEITSLYYNTNKTADARLSGNEKGFEVPWPDLQTTPIEDQPYYWLEKLRNWQEKFNPVTHPTSWRELPKIIFGNEKSEETRAAFVDNYFLFRMAEGKTVFEKRCPLGTNIIEICWDKLLFKFQNDLKNSKETHPDGSPIIFFDKDGRGKTSIAGRALFTLHGIRVSLITALAMDGGMDINTLMKLVGHSRLLMTIYYVKPGQQHMKDAILGATQRLSEKASSTIVAFLANAKSEDLVKTAVFNAAHDVFSVVEENPANRNPAGWMMMMEGICLAGGNTSVEIVGEKSRGCHNGGPKINSRAHGPVPGGIRNCIRCRWFATRPEFIDALRARMNNISFYLNDATNESARLETLLEKLRIQKYESEISGIPFSSMSEMKSTERLYETSINKTLSLGVDWSACNKLITRCSAQARKDHSDSIALIPVGDAMEVVTILEEIDSKLLHVSGICQDIEIYPDLNPGEAVRELGQILDSKLERENMKPFFYRLSKTDQLKYANKFMQQLSHSLDTNPIVGLKKACKLIEGNDSLAEKIQGDISSFLEFTPHEVNRQIPIRLVHT